MSRISEISRRYHESLSDSQQQYEGMYAERYAATEQFYGDFFHQLICDYGTRFANERFRARIQERIERELGTDTLNFIAVDGTCRREVFDDMVTFFGGAYGARGSVQFTGDSSQIRYKRWSLEQDVSMVAWVPVPFARLEEVTPGVGEQFLVTEEERVNLSAVHTQVMQLAEIFLAYNSIRSSQLDAPHILLMDLSPSSVLASVAQAQATIGLEGYPYDRRALSKADITVALAHPFSEFLAIPQPKMMDLYRMLIAELVKKPDQEVDLASLANRLGMNVAPLLRAALFLCERGVLARTPISSRFVPQIHVGQSWAYVRDFFQNICHSLFIQKDPRALQYEAKDERGVLRRRWMAPDDLGFLIGVGMRLLVEECWARNVLFYSIVKDSSSRYLTRNFLGVALETGFYPELQTLQVGMLPWTDRIFCEALPEIDPSLAAPWCTVEFDSAFMTLHRERDETGKTQIAGVMGRIVNQERLFMRSLGQFFLKRDKGSPLMGHVVFLERLLSPHWDKFGSEQGPAQIAVNTREIGNLSVLAWRDRDHVNPGQWVMMYLLSVLTRNHFAEAIGYPDPLHKADWGAKTIGESVAATMQSSGRMLRAQPLSRTFRQIRAAGRR